MSYTTRLFSHANEDPTGQWQQLVAEAAYYLAQRRHFEPGSELDDWLFAEAQMDAELVRKRLTNAD